MALLMTDECKRKIAEGYFKECMIQASYEALIDEGYYKKPYESMELHQQIRCKVDAERAIRMIKRALEIYRGIA